jgi:hypothetical protein
MNLVQKDAYNNSFTKPLAGNGRGIYTDTNAPTIRISEIGVRGDTQTAR